jgi:adenosylcobinamide hydrolase
MFDTARRDGVTEFASPGTRWLATGPGGGFSEADTAYNVTVPEGFDREDLDSYARERRRAAGFDGDGPTLLTGVAQRHARGVRSGPVVAYATAGLSNPATLPIGDDGTDSPPRIDDRRPGTVNTVVGTTRSLSDGAMATLLSTVVEAKTATLQSAVGFTGTTSDAVVVGCRPEGETAAFAGSATPVGEAARVCVSEAILAALDARYDEESPPESVAAARYGVRSQAETEPLGPVEPR